MSSSFTLFPDLVIPIETISLATKGFTTLIGHGGGGDVYIGQLPRDGEIIPIAVKRLRGLSRQQQDEFTAEVTTLGYCRHRNIVSIVGYCRDLEKDEYLLVYKYAEGKSLNTYLYTTCPLTWNQRIKICIDVATGLEYFYSINTECQFIHRDIKGANILLDRNMTAMIADFGLCTMGFLNKSQAVSNVSGTPGYVDPAYVKTGLFTYKSDVYSFGVVLFELLCGRLCFKNGDQQTNLVPLARRCYEEGRLKEIMDLDLKDSESMKEFSKIAYQCVNDDPERRPSMDLLLQKLKQVLELQELETSESQAIEGTVEFYEQRDQISELQGFRGLPTSLKSQAIGEHNGDQRWLNEPPSLGSVRPIQGSLINQPNGQTDEKIMSLTDFGYRNGISNNQDRDIISEYDVDDQPISIGGVAKDRFSNPSIVIGDPYAGDKAMSSISDFARPQPSQTGGWLTNKENDYEN